MRITGVETITVNVPFKAAHRSAGRVGRGVTRTIVKVHTDNRVTGLGETLHYQSKHVIDHVLTPAVIGEDPLEIPRLRARCLIGKDQYGAPSRAWESDPWAFSGFEMALFDILGKVTETPVYRLLGQLCRRRIPFVEYVYPLVHRMKPAEIADDCAVRIAASGVNTLELKVGILQPDRDVETVKRIRKLVGPDIAIRIDANSAWSVATSIRTLSAMEEYNLANAEEPCRGLVAMAQVRRSVRIPLSTHCGDVPAVVGLGAADNIVFDLLSEGGLLSAVETAKAADAAGHGFWMRSTGELGIGTAAIMHLAAAMPGMSHANQTVLNLLVDDVVKEPWHIHGGYGELPDTPGLGVELDDGKVERYARLHAEEGTYWFWRAAPQASE